MEIVAACLSLTFMSWTQLHTEEDKKENKTKATMVMGGTPQEDIRT